MQTSNKQIPMQDLESVKAPLDEASFLPPDFYGRDSHFVLEKERVLKNNWLVVGRWEQVEKRGDYFTIDLLEEPLLIVRDKNKVKALSNVCLHRAGPVAKGSGNRKSFTCPYHLWSYALDGSFKASPFMDMAKNFNKKNCSLNEFPVTEWQGFIFVNLSKNAAPLVLGRIGGIDEIVSPYNLNKLKRLEPIHFSCPWDWKISVENVMEFYHYPGVHGDTVGASFDLQNSTDAEFEKMVETLGAKNQYKAGQGKPYAYGMQSSKQSLKIPGMPAYELSLHLNDKQIGVHVFPNLSLIITPTFTVWPHIIIESENHHRLEYILLVHPEFAAHADHHQAREHLRDMIKNIHEEDMPILAHVAKGLRSENHVAGRICRLEYIIWQFHNWMLEQLTILREK